MGYVNFSMPREIVLKFKTAGRIVNFVETGTYRGGTSYWAAKHFDKVYTIEIDPEISRDTASKKGSTDNIEFLIGNSRDVLPELTTKLKDRSVFWLDGHWCNVTEIGKDMECPLMDELKALKNIKDPTILIDDARAFLGPLPPPHNNKDWPRIDEIFQVLKLQFPESMVTVVDDVIYCIPPDLIETFNSDYVANFNSRFHQRSPGLLRRFIGKLTRL